VLVLKKKASPPSPADGFAIRSPFDLRLVPGASLFLIHRRKPDVWFRVLASDGAGNLRLQTPYGVSFPSRADISTERNYAAVLGPSDAVAPSFTVIVAVQSAPKSAWHPPSSY
jgi:hypothetical protein